jgi:hypothetical protein
MKSILHILALVLAASCLNHIAAQEATQTPPAKRKFEYNGKIEKTYDEAKDQTLVYFKLMPIKAVEDVPETYSLKQWSDERLEITMYFAYPGKKFATPQWVTVGFLSSTENPQKYTDFALVAVADKQQLELGTMRVLQTVNYARRGKLPLIRQTMELPIPYQDFLRLANAKKVTFRLGSAEFGLEKEHLEAIRDLAVHTVP